MNTELEKAAKDYHAMVFGRAADWTPVESHTEKQRLTDITSAYRAGSDWQAKQNNDAMMISFAAFCGKNGENGCGYDPKTDRWLLDDVASATTAEMLEGWKKQQIPLHLIDV